MTPRTISLLIRITAKQYAEAAGQLRDGNFNANPLTQALIEQGEFMLSGYTTASITLIHIATGRRYSGSTPAVLTDFLAGFQRGVRVLEDHEFDLVRVSGGD